MDNNNVRSRPSRPSKIKRKKKKAGATPPPRNTVTLSLEGSVKEFVQNYRLCQSHYRYWLLWNSKFCVRYGSRIIFTTPIKGTFFYVLTYQNSFVVLVIDARMGWLMGFFTAKGMFQMKSKDISGLHMYSHRCNELSFGGNHGNISQGGTGNTKLNLDRFRKCFQQLRDYEKTGRKDNKNGNIESAIGLMVVVLLETKFRDIYKHVCSAMEQSIDIKLGQCFREFIVNWSSISKEVMFSLDKQEYKPHDCGNPQLESLDHLMDASFYLHVDGYFDGLFKHDQLAPPPRIMIWSEIDFGGDGEDDIPLPPEPRGPLRAAAGNALPTQKPGLSGGKLGGQPDAPEWFVQWSENPHDHQWEIILSHLRDEVGLEVRDANRAVSSVCLRKLHAPQPEQPAQYPQEDPRRTRPGSRSRTHQAFVDELESVRHQLISDGTI